MKKFLLISIFSLSLMSFTPFAFAEDEVTENLKERLKSAVGGPNAINEVKSQTTLKGYIGTVTDIIQNTIILEDKEGKKSVRIDDDSTLVRSPGSSDIKLDSVRIDDSIIVIGDPTGLDEDEIAGKRIIVSATALTPPDKLSGLGVITSIDRYSYTLDTKNMDQPVELFFTGKTTYKSPSSALDFSDISEGDEILFTAVKDKDDDWSATIVLQLKPASPSTEPLQ